MNKIVCIILFLLLCLSCRVEKNLTKNPHKILNTKQSHVQPHHSHSDKPTKIRVYNAMYHNARFNHRPIKVK
mgnify:CR=1 FL=1